MRETISLPYELLIPEYILGGLAILIVAVDLFMPKVRKEMLPYITAAGLLVAFCVSLIWIDNNDDFGGLIFIDDYTTFFRCFFIATTFAVVLASAQYVQKNLHNPASTTRC